MEALKQIEELVSTKLAIIKTIFSIIKLETRLAGLSIFPLLMNVCMLLIVLMSVWVLISLLMGYGILLIFHNVLISLLSVFFVNLIILLSLIKYLTYNLRNMSFEKTRAYLANHKSPNNE